MSQNASALFHGFSVYQPALGSPLQWLPALGSQELDSLVNAFLPGPASIQDKRAHISMDFYEFSRQTGESFKFYPVPSAHSPSSPTATTPSSTAAMCDSGYVSGSVNPSPAVSDMSPWMQPTFSFGSAAAATHQSRRTSSSSSARASPARKQAATSTDFSSHPGMRIMTKDGRDVTNSASRGCKTKEQRDHAHLMRVIKACDACRRKKIRCDPSHKKRSAQTEAKSAKKSRVSLAASSASRSPTAAIAPTPSLHFATADPATEVEPASAPLFPLSEEFTEDFWNQFIRFEDEPVPAVPFPDELDLVGDLAGSLSSSSGSFPTTPSQSSQSFNSQPVFSQPFTSQNFFSGVPSWTTSCDPVNHPSQDPEPTLPYLNPGGHGTNYIDFNLYSPASSFADDEPQIVSGEAATAGPNRLHSAGGNTPSSSRDPRRQGHSPVRAAGVLLANQPFSPDALPTGTRSISNLVQTIQEPPHPPVPPCPPSVAPRSSLDTSEDNSHRGHSAVVRDGLEQWGGSTDRRSDPMSVRSSSPSDAIAASSRESLGRRQGAAGHHAVISSAIPVDDCTVAASAPRATVSSTLSSFSPVSASPSPVPLPRSIGGGISAVAQQLGTPSGVARRVAATGIPSSASSVSRGERQTTAPVHPIAAPASASRHDSPVTPSDASHRPYNQDVTQSLREGSAAAAGANFTAPDHCHDIHGSAHVSGRANNDQQSFRPLFASVNTVSSPRPAPASRVVSLVLPSDVPLGWLLAATVLCIGILSSALSCFLSMETLRQVPLRSITSSHRSSRRPATATGSCSRSNSQTASILSSDVPCLPRQGSAGMASRLATLRGQLGASRLVRQGRPLAVV